ncbi:hypothetical protein [Bacillus sp. ISL-55]|uniref:hypothetical protein n=1 Tax=Bacillus sp. ISL-55 TaxID=2819134 RepID=UPI001BEC04EA|nr:hypothetical protein [Bacillus sp. ISL-55]MBT2691792.1 hypothetical protein [Bacillus sp. ISL-55]
MKLDFDFTNSPVRTTLGVYAGSGANTTLSDNPEGIAMWVYGMPEAPGYSLHILIVDGNNKSQALNFTGEKPGIDLLLT